MNEALPVHMPLEKLADFCRQYQVRALALFGSTLRQDHRPDSDIDLLVSFEPAARQPDAAKAILALKICDPACGSGHFLIAAAHRIARRLAAVRPGAR